MEIIVDAYGGEEQAMGWYYYLADRLQFPFDASCIVTGKSYRLKNKGGKDESGKDQNQPRGQDDACQEEG